MMKKSPFLFVCMTALILTSCTSDTEPDAFDCTSVTFNVNVTAASAACDTPNGSLTVSGAPNNSEFSIDGSNFQTDNTFSGLASGNYTVTVRDENGCTTTVSATIANEADLAIDSIETTDAGCGTSNGTITVTASGASGNYQYSIEGGTPQDSNVISGLASGTYIVIVTDAEGCQVTQEVSVSSGEVSFSATIQPLITTRCALSGCHGENNGSRPDFRTAENIQASAERIKARTGGRSMPPTAGGGPLSDDLIAQIACWVDDGADISN